MVFTKVWLDLNAIWNMGPWYLAHTVTSINWSVLKVTVLSRLHKFWRLICVCIGCGVEKLWVFCLHRLLYKASFFRTQLISQHYRRHLKIILWLLLPDGSHMWRFSFNMWFSGKYRSQICRSLLFLKIFIIEPFNDFEQVGLEKDFFLINVLIDKFFNPVKVEIL